MPQRRFLTAACIAAASAALLASSALPASAAEPGEGAVLFNADGSPIGSELTYGPDATPQFVYTSLTSDDDFWGLDASGVPANDLGDFEPIATGIPLDFDVTIGGTVYDTFLVNSNGALCLFNSELGVTEPDDWCWIYDALPGEYSAPEFTEEAGAYAIFDSFATDQNPVDIEPVDTDADGIEDGCTFGAAFFEFEGSAYCSSVFWGTTTYEGRPALAATWYHNPDYNVEQEEETFFVTHQILLVDAGDGNTVVVYNYDDVQFDGEDASFGKLLIDVEYAYSDACAAAFGTEDAPGDRNPYVSIGAGAVDSAQTSTFIDLFGPECAEGQFPTPGQELLDDGESALIANSLNSDVAGRYVFGVVDGEFTLTPPVLGGGTVTPPPAPTPEAEEPELAATGAEATFGFGAAAAALLAGLALLAARRQERARS